MPTHRTPAGAGIIAPDPTPPVLAGWLSPFRAYFSAPVWSRVLVLVAGAVLAPGKRTVSQALRVMGLAAGPGFARYHEVLNRAHWDGRAVARALLVLVLGAFPPAGEVVLGVDDVPGLDPGIERRWGPKIKARGLYRDPVRSSRGHFVRASGLRWLSLMVMVPIPWLDGGYVRSRHRREGRHFEVIAGKVIDADGVQHRFAFTRTGQAASAATFGQVLAAAGVNAKTLATVLCDGDAGLWRLQRKVLPDATVVLDWWHAAIRFEHALQSARGLSKADTHSAQEAVRALERAKWRLWHGRWPGCRRKLAALCHWAECKAVRDVAGMDKLRQHAGNLLAYLERNEAALVHATRPGAGAVSRSRRRSWRAGSTRSSPGA